jgi:hypothetical protein
MYQMNYSKSRALYTALAFGLVLMLLLPGMASAGGGGFIGPLTHNDLIASTVPANGDINPYGVAVVHRSMGALVQGDVLVSNFNNKANAQGTGITIVEIAPKGHGSLFAQIMPSDLTGSCPGGIGLTTALVALRSGWVIVGSLPASDGTAATAKAGCLIVLNSRGHVVETLSGGLINGPWDMTAAEGEDWAALFVTNVLNGTVAAGGLTVNRGTVVRIGLSIPDADSDDRRTLLPHEISRTVIGSGFGEKTDPAALVIGPTGVGLGRDGTLYVADTIANRIAAIPNALFRLSSAGVGRTVSKKGSGLNGPLGLTIAPNGDILTTNAGDGNMIETTPGGTHVATKIVDASTPGGAAGTLFGLDIATNGKGVYFVNDGNNALYLLH